MIVVTGTKRSGTSLWMQILRAAGLPSIGEAFPADWHAAYRDANPEGFFESRFRDGVNFTNNPDPETGLYLHPADVPFHAIKIFVPGLTKTDLSFVERVVAGVRDVREYDASVRALDALTDARATVALGLPPPLHPTPYLEWWRDNYALVVDTMTRRYPMRAVALDDLVAAPAEHVRDVLAFIGTGDLAAATEAVKPSLRRNDRRSLAAPDGLPPALLPAFDLLYDVLAHGPPEGEAWIDRLGEAHLALLSSIDEDFARVAGRREERSRILGRSEDA